MCIGVGILGREGGRDGGTEGWTEGRREGRRDGGEEGARVNDGALHKRFPISDSDKRLG